MSMLDEIITLSIENQQLNRFIRDNVMSDNANVRESALKANLKLGANIAKMSSLAQAERAIFSARLKSSDTNPAQE